MFKFITNFLSGFQMQIMGGLLVVILTMSATGWLYYNHTQSTISTLNQNIATINANNTTLKTQITNQNKSINTLKDARQQDQQTIADMAIRFGKTQAEVDILNKKLARHNLHNLTIKKPMLIQHIINKASVKVFDDFEKISDPSTYVLKKEKKK